MSSMDGHSDDSVYKSLKPSVAACLVADALRDYDAAHARA
jgi:hypothetical protein